jgi:hypothetical protein
MQQQSEKPRLIFDGLGLLYHKTAKFADVLLCWIWINLLNNEIYCKIEYHLKIPFFKINQTFYPDVNKIKKETIFRFRSKL